MTTPGPKPTPTETKRRRGNPGRRPLNEREPEPPRGAPPMPEDYFDTEGERAWKWLCKQLDTMGTLAESDEDLMILFCDTRSEYRKNRQAVRKYGGVLISPKSTLPFIGAHTNYEAMLKKQLHTCITELGLSSSSRTRILGPEKGDDDPLLVLLQRRLQRQKGAEN